MAAIRFAEAEEAFKLEDKSLFLIGHSWGGSAVAEAIGHEYAKNVTASVSLAGYNSPINLMIAKGNEYMEMDTSAFRIAYQFNHMLNFGWGNSQRTALASINQSTTPLLLVHGNEDEMISYDKVSIVSKIDEIKNPNVETLIITDAGQNGHSSILHAKDSISYREEENRKFKEKLDSLSAEEKADNQVIYKLREDFVNGIDREQRDLFNKTNTELMDKIIAFFERSKG